MKKTLILTLVGVLLISGSAFAAGRQLVAQPNATFNPGVGGAGFGPATTNNDDSCDIGTAPAATLLLPYFEVDLAAAGAGRTTVFTITNVSPYAQIAHIVLYTDWSFPVLDFNIFLTGYDVQALNLFDIIGRGLIGGTTGTSTSSPNAVVASGTGFNNSIANVTAITTGSNPSIGTQPFRTTAGDLFGNPNFLGTVATNCASGRLPGQLPGPLATDVRLALSTGRVTGTAIGCSPSNQIGGDHGANTAIGYVTVDVAATCSQALPTETAYFTGEILFDNVLIGEYFDVNQSATAGNYAGGNPMVHIRAVPEGGGVASTGTPTGGTNLPYTFYDRYTFGLIPRTIDRRQPLPSAFAARWISGSTALFDTQYKIWREGYTGNDTFETTLVETQCTAAERNQDLDIAEFVRFDENENASVIGLGGIIVSPPPPGAPGLPEAVRISINNSLFPVLASGSTQVGGWMYMNLNNGGDVAAQAAQVAQAGLSSQGLYSASRAGWGVALPAGGFTRDVSQNWVVVSMFAEGRYGADFDAAWMGNGCSTDLPIAATSGTASSPLGRIGPAGNSTAGMPGVLVCPPGTTATSGSGAVAGSGGGTGGYPNGTVNCIGTNVTP